MVQGPVSWLSLATQGILEQAMREGDETTATQLQVKPADCGMCHWLQSSETGAC